MKTKTSALPALLALTTLLVTAPSFAAVISLFGWGFNLDGTTYCNRTGCTNTGQGSLPGAVDASGFNFTTGLGVVSITTGGIGAHSVFSFFDHDIDTAANTFFNEGGVTINTAAAGQSWEIDYLRQPPAG